MSEIEVGCAEAMTEFSKQIKRDIVIRIKTSGTITVYFEGCGITFDEKDSAITYAEGRGATIAQAFNDYAKRISGKMLVDLHNPYNIIRHNVPNLIESCCNEGEN